MFATLKDLFDAILPPTAAQTAAEQRSLLQLATAVLVVEVMRADPEIGPAERRAAIAGLGQQFALADDAVDRLLDLAADTARGASDFFSFTSRINDGFDMDHKVQIIEHLWRVAYADGKLDAAENHVMRKIGDLLYIPHGAYVNAKLRARDEAGAE
jgi:uncharacterized tellurite resistance protein B-like protein